MRPREDVPHLRRSSKCFRQPTLPASHALASGWANLWSRLSALALSALLQPRESLNAAL